MPQLEVAHLREQNQDMIIAPLDDNFELKSSSQQQAIIRQIQLAATSAGLRGTVVVVWEDARGRMKFIAPKPWHPLFRSLDMRRIGASLNKTLSW